MRTRSLDTADRTAPLSARGFSPERQTNAGTLWRTVAAGISSRTGTGGAVAGAAAADVNEAAVPAPPGVGAAAADVDEAALAATPGAGAVAIGDAGTPGAEGGGVSLGALMTGAVLTCERAGIDAISGAGALLFAMSI